MLNRFAELVVRLEYTNVVHVILADRSGMHILDVMFRRESDTWYYAPEDNVLDIMGRDFPISMCIPFPINEEGVMYDEESDCYSIEEEDVEWEIFLD